MRFGRKKKIGLEEGEGEVGEGLDFSSLQAPGPCRLGKRLVGFCG